MVQTRLQTIARGLRTPIGAAIQAAREASAPVRAELPSQEVPTVELMAETVESSDDDDDDDDVLSGLLSVSQAPKRAHFSLPVISGPTGLPAPTVKSDVEACEDAISGLSADSQLQLLLRLSKSLLSPPSASRPTSPTQPKHVRQPQSPTPLVETPPSSIRLRKKKGKGKRHSESDRSDSDRSMSSYEYVDKKEPRVGKQVYIESVHGDWFQYRASLLEDAQSKLSEEEKYTMARASVKVYGSLQKVSHQQNIPLLRHTLDQVKRATEYRTWIKRIAPIFLINDASAALLNPDTFEINTTVALKLSLLRGVANFIQSKVVSRYHQEFLDIDSLDSLSMLVRLRNYCIPSNPTIRNDLHKEMRNFRMLPDEDGGQ